MKLEAVSIGSQTLLAYNNCFDIHTADGKSYGVVNFYVETLNKLLSDNVITWPIQVTKLGEYNVKIDDPRIPLNFYNIRFCETCTPREFWPQEQLDRRQYHIDNGELIVDGIGNSWKLTKQESRTVGYNGEIQICDAGYSYAPYIPINKIPPELK